ncbi:helix-turn-helix transcriptional regulator [Pseudoalteromonas luteoviolacea]|uniref:HTH araC/xylS-type domain-containing protein n=1 Tax=Pseudoalteromonas luteoviolacea S4060-1 TaxID=1365257 RepID=A0A162B8P3_9GAMM|nr:AraC family transcriptional regulator [Pseudoalteromonas luteoviolacea]KZN68363.1 hypothetical protein N478_14450 [Pseudoalteromonas luteoviolacea S4060-1]
MYIQPGIFAAYTGVIDTKPHQHHQIQLTLPAGNCTLLYNNGLLTGPHIIPSNCSHKLTMDEGWIILIEPFSDIGQQLQSRYRSCHPQALEEAPKLGQATPLESLILSLKLNYPVHNTNLDPRIAALLELLDSNFENKINMEASHWRASKVATRLHLSESRFLHIFRAQMGIAWRPYLVWKRIICAIGYLQQQQNITEAAVNAGFSDSAHFSRSFKKQFGINPKNALKLI